MNHGIDYKYGYTIIAHHTVDFYKQSDCSLVDLTSTRQFYLICPDLAKICPQISKRSDTDLPKAFLNTQIVDTDLTIFGPQIPIFADTILGPPVRSEFPKRPRSLQK